jgi:hypothetical protein
LERRALLCRPGCGCRSLPLLQLELLLGALLL